MQQEDTILVPEITTFCRSRGFWTTFNFELERPYTPVLCSYQISIAVCVPQKEAIFLMGRGSSVGKARDFSPGHSRSGCPTPPVGSVLDRPRQIDGSTDRSEYLQLPTFDKMGKQNFYTSKNAIKYPCIQNDICFTNEHSAQMFF